MQDLYYTEVKSHSATDTKDGSACESPESQSVFTTDHRLFATYCL